MLILFSVPNGSPTITNVSVLTTRSVFVQWSEVSLILQNGIITEYTVVFIPNVTANQPNVTQRTSNLSISVEGLVPITVYNVTVTASTRIGPGPSSTPMEVGTPADGELYTIIFICVLGVTTNMFTLLGPEQSLITVAT